jgi:hypothetical protein
MGERFRLKASFDISLADPTQTASASVTIVRK